MAKTYITFTNISTMNNKNFKDIIDDLEINSLIT
jgi:hypothetical protein